MSTENNNAVVHHKNEHREIDTKSFDDLMFIVDTIKSQIPKEHWVNEVGVICGSGLGPIAEQVENGFVLPYHKIPGFPTPHVVGHKGNMVFGTIAGRKVVCIQGRFHPYEHDMNLSLCTLPVRVMAKLGIETLVVSNAAGGVSPKLNFGDLMLIKDHIFLPGLAGYSPLVGVNDPRFGARFVSVHDAYDRSLRGLARSVAVDMGIPLHEGIYVMSGGPQYETPAEVMLFKTCGADALGMSTAHEVTVARQEGIRCLGISLITNIANTDVDTAVVVSHEEVLEAAAKGGQVASTFVKNFLARLPEVPRTDAKH